MWSHYRRTFVYLQPFIVIVTLLDYLYSHDFAAAFVQLFVPMQVCAILGAAWAVRLERQLRDRR